jgi:hypothetical protein
MCYAHWRIFQANLSVYTFMKKKRTMSPISRTVSCKSPPPFGHALARRHNRCILHLKKGLFYVIMSSNDVIASKILVIWNALIKCFHMKYYKIWFFRFQNLTLEYTIFYPGINHEGEDRSAPKTNRWSGNYHTRFGVDSIKIT